MLRYMRNLAKGERGITGLETAIILVAFVVVAAVFSFAVLSAGTFSTQKSEEAVYAGLEEVRSTVELKGSIVATSTTAGSGEGIDAILFTIATATGGEPVDLSTKPNNVMVIDYLDKHQRHTDMYWTVSWKGENDGDGLLEEGELAQIRVCGTGSSCADDMGLSPALSVTTDFALEVKPVKGATLRIEKRTPDYIDKINVLD